MTRATFRPTTTAIAWQRQLRDVYAAAGTPDVPHLDLARAVVRPVSRRLAEQIIHQYEWLGTMAPTGHHYGIFYGAFCAGVCCIGTSIGGGVRAYEEFGLQAGEMVTLARGACVHWAPSGSNSKLVAWSCRLVARDTRAKLIIAFADTDAGEIGTIYQACNWTYIGRGKTTHQFVAPNGRVYDQKLAYDLRRAAGFRRTRADYVAALRAAGWTEQTTNAKHRYVCVLDKTDTALLARVAAMRQTYPKRAGEATSVATGHPPAQDGATPIRPLYFGVSVP